MNTANAWIEKGYEHFAMVGPINFSVKKISEENKLSRTTFNYHFTSQEDFIHELLNAHLEENEKFLVAAKTDIQHYIPDLHILLNKFSIGVHFQLQLFNHRYNPDFDRVYRQCNKSSSDSFIIDRFMDYYKLKLTIKQSTELHNILIDAWYSRLNKDDITVENMINIIEDLMTALAPLLKH